MIYARVSRCALAMCCHITMSPRAWVRCPVHCIYHQWFAHCSAGGLSPRPTRQEIRE